MSGAANLLSITGHALVRRNDVFADSRRLRVSTLAAPPSLSVVIPVYDEAANIAGLLVEVDSHLRLGTPYEIIVVDDGSRDGTLELLRTLRERATLPLRVLHHQSNLGQSAAQRSGIRAARAEWVVTLDGDGQNDPGDIGVLLAAARDHGEKVRLVCGRRARRRDSWSRRVASRIANGVRRRCLGDDTLDSGCGLKLIHRQTFLELPFFDHMHRFLPALVKQAGCGVMTVEVNHRPRVHGRSKYGLNDRLWTGIVDMFGVLWLGRRRRRPQVAEL